MEHFVAQADFQAHNHRLNDSLVVTFNVGSATLKMGVYLLAESILSKEEALQFSVNVDLKNAECKYSGIIPEALSDFVVSSAKETALSFLNKIEPAYKNKNFIFVHRVVHGGRYIEPVKITSDVLNQLHELAYLAPLHQPPALAIIDAIEANYQAHGFIQVAAFDTAFHAQRPRLWSEYAIPKKLRDDGVKAYGFHGLSYQSIMRSLKQTQPDVANKRIIIAHLGSGCSITSVANGQSINSTLGFSGLDGVPMGTRPGRLDPGVLLYLLEKGWSHKQMTQCLYKESGLLGLSGISNDVRELSQSTSESAQFALDYFAAHAAKEISALIPSLKGLDAIIFTAGIGEHQANVREQIIEHLGWYRVFIDKQKNQNVNLEQGIGDISASNSDVQVLIIQTDEQLELFMSALNI